MANAAQIWADGPSVSPYQPDKALLRAWGKRVEQQTSLVNSPLTYDATGDGTTNDAAKYAMAEAGNDNVFLPSDTVFNLGSALPVKPVYGPGSVLSNGIIRDGALPLHLTDRSSIRMAPRGLSADDWLLGPGQTPAAGNHGNVLIGVGIQDSGSTTTRTTAVGSLVLTKNVESNRNSVFGQGALRFTKYSERIDAFGSLVMQWGGANLADDPAGDFYSHSVIFNADAPVMALGTPGAYTLNPAYNAVNSAFNLDPADAQTVVDWMNTTPWVTSTPQFAYNQGFGRDCLNNIIKGYGNVGYGYRAGAILLEGNDNTMIGNNALGNTLFSNGNVAAGHTAGFLHKTGDNNVYVGNGAGYRHKNGGSSIFIGSNAGNPSNTFTADWSILIGLDAGIRGDGTSPASLSNKLIIQDRFTRNPLLNGSFGTPNGKLGINLPIDNAVRGTLHVFSEASGFAGTVGLGADDLVIENNDNVGITLLSPADKIGTLGFGDPGGSLRGFLQYDHNDDSLRLGAGGATRLQVTGTGMGFNGTAPVAKPTGVAVTAAAIHAALVSYGLIAA